MSKIKPKTHPKMTAMQIMERQNANAVDMDKVAAQIEQIREATALKAHSVPNLEVTTDWDLVGASFFVHARDTVTGRTLMSSKAYFTPRLYEAGRLAKILERVMAL
tara:strand:+ start:6618 stop:6935 length:318 start_codon:yes stop_codon:yes gene_type:complete